MTATVVLVPVILLALLLVVQFSLAYYARVVVAGAAQDGASAAARQGSSGSAGAALADQLIGEGAGSLLVSYSSTGATDGETVTVNSRGRVISILPFFGGISVTASGSAAVERFRPQNDP